MLEEDTNFAEEFYRVFDNADILEADYFTPKLLEEKYVDMEIALPIDGEGPKFVKVKKPLWDANGIPIGRYHENPMLATIV